MSVQSMKECEVAVDRARELVEKLCKLDPDNPLLRFRRFAIFHDSNAWSCQGSVPPASEEETFLHFVPERTDRKSDAREEVAKLYFEDLKKEIERIELELDDIAC